MEKYNAVNLGYLTAMIPTIIMIPESAVYQAIGLLILNLIALPFALKR